MKTRTGCSSIAIEKKYPLFDLNSSVKPEDEERLSRQARDILSYFRYMNFRLKLDVSTADLRDKACQYNSRINEIRRYLVKYKNQCIDLVKKGKNGLNFYRIVPIEQSEFYKNHKDKL